MYNIEEIKQQFSEVIEYTQGIKKIKIDDLFAAWEKNKKFFIEYFHGNLIYTYPEEQTFVMSDEDKESQFQSFKLLMFDDEYYEPNLSQFLESISCKEFFNNSTVKDYYYDDNKKVPKGMKVIKAFKHFITNKERLRQVQDKASELIQQQEIKGYVHISVHPLDYLSLSENAHNWTSCHGLFGDCRAGNFSYMADASTAIVYIADKEHRKISNFPIEWNSKKWRMLLHFSADRMMVFAGRPYPFSIQSAKEFINSHLLKNLDISAISNTKKYLRHFDVSHYCWSSWYNNIISKVSYKTNSEEETYLAHRYIPIGGELVRLDKCVHNITSGDEALHYNDILYSSVYSPEWIVLGNKYNYDLTDEETTYFEIGSEIKCLNCGKEILDDASQVFCDECYGKLEICDLCNQTIELNKEVWLNNGATVVCKECYKNEIMTCEKCGLQIPKEYIYFDEEKEIFICEECAKGEK